ncbi:MAG: cell division protein FtsA [Synergistes sp.]|nr:cell division protein FtsA [Synergistes sp.]
MFKKTSRLKHGNEPELIVGLDIGTSKISVVVAERGEETGEAEIIGAGQASSNGIRKGLVVNLDQAVKSIKQAVLDAQNMVGQEFDEVTVSFGGGEVRSVHSKGMVTLGRTPRPVAELDLERVIEAAQANVAVPPNQIILHTIPVEYTLDDTNGIDDPLGMNATRLEVDLQSIIVPKTTIQNVINCVNRADLSVKSLVIKPIVSALGVLAPEDETAGSVVLDIGGGTTGVTVFAEGRLKHLAVIPVGGDHITNDIGAVLKLPLNKAEEVKHEVSLVEDFEENESISVNYRGQEYPILKEDLYNIVTCRIGELVDDLVRSAVKESKIQLLPGGVIITGGVAKSLGIDEFVSDVLELSARVAKPTEYEKMPPQFGTEEFSAAAGIIRYITERERDPFRYLDNPSILKNERTRRSAPVPDFLTKNDNEGPKNEASAPRDILGKILAPFKELF